MEPISAAGIAKTSPGGMTFAQFQQMNDLRCREAFNHPEWTIFDWALCIAGEAGELCDALKKVRRGDYTLDKKRDAILKEIADVMIYCDLAFTCLEASTDVELINKFDEVSGRVGWRTPKIGLHGMPECKICGGGIEGNQCLSCGTNRSEAQQICPLPPVAIKEESTAVPASILAIAPADGHLPIAPTMADAFRLAGTVAVLTAVSEFTDDLASRITKAQISGDAVDVRQYLR
jgi:NTP pyrophosphatase (non-canonical NTP hydrolase)